MKSHRLALSVYFACSLIIFFSHSANAQSDGRCPITGSLPSSSIPRIVSTHEERHKRVIETIQSHLNTATFESIGLGDSIMQGWPDDLLRKALGASALNAGVGGDKTQNLLWRLEHFDWSKQKPKSVLLIIGTNNLSTSAPCEIALGIRNAVAKVHSIFPLADIAVISLLPRGEKMSAYEPEIRQINNELRRRAQLDGYIFIDANPLFICDDETKCALVKGPSNVHPTRSGYEQLTDFVSHELNRLHPQ